MTEPIIPTTFAIANNQASSIVVQKKYHEVIKNKEEPIITDFFPEFEQASKLGLEHNKSIISVYEKYQVIQLDQTPLIITLIADSTANTGKIFLNKKKYTYIFF